MSLRKGLTYGSLAAVLVVVALFAAWKGFGALVARSGQASQASWEASCKKFGAPIRHEPIKVDGYRRQVLVRNMSDVAYLALGSYQMKDALQDLAGARYRFVEVDVNESNQNQQRAAVGDAMQLIRYQLAERGDPACASYEKTFAEHWPLRRDAREFGLPDSLCVAMIRSDASYARYVIDYSEPRLEPDASYTWQQYSVRDVLNVEPVARFRGFTIPGGRHGSLYSCGASKDVWDLVDRTLVPSDAIESMQKIGIADDSPVMDFYRQPKTQTVDARNEAVPSTVAVTSRLLRRDRVADTSAALGPGDDKPLWDWSIASTGHCAMDCLRLNLPTGSFLVSTPGGANSTNVDFARVTPDAVHVLSTVPDGTIVINTYSLDGHITGSQRTELSGECAGRGGRNRYRALESTEHAFQLSYAQMENNRMVALCEFEIPKAP